ncbi:MAG TPA: DUF642 domain-containing protein [Verrucomicrobiae bacterium]
MKTLIRYGYLCPCTLLAVGCLMVSAPVHGAIVQNPSFESNWNPAYPHYGAIDSWTGGTGVNDRSLDRGGPFHDNGLTPDGNRVAFKQQGGDLSQDIFGLSIGQLYWVQFYYNTRGDVLSGTCDITTRFNGIDLDTVTGIQRVTAPEGTNPIVVPFYPRSVPFVADTDMAALTFHVNTVGDRTALFDAITVVARDTNDVTVMNPSFEASGPSAAGPFVTNRLAGWAGTGVFGVDIAFGMYADNGVIPDQDLTAFIQGAGSLAQTLRNLVPGTQYQLLFAYNANTAGSPHLQVKADNTVVFETDVAAVGIGNAFHTNISTFTATSNQVALSFAQTKAGSDVLLFDNVRVLGQTATALPPMQVTPARAELAPGQSVIVSLVVPSERLALGPATITVASSDTNILRLVGAGANGTVALTYDKNGATTKTVEAVGVRRGIASVTVPDSAGLVVPNSVLVHVVESFVRNPSFEAEAASTGLGLGPILAWEGAGTTGLNRIDQAFAAGSGPIPDRLQVALIQGVGSLSQQVTNLTPGASYWLQFRYALRDIVDPSGPATDLIVKLGAQPLVTISHIIPLSQTGSADYYFTNVVFTPTNASGALQFATANPQGDATLLLDAINIIRRDAGEIVVQNPSFEASGAMELYIEGPNTAPLCGWTIPGSPGHGTAATGPFADNGLVPDQDQALFLQGAAGVLQVVPGFTTGQKYSVIYSVNNRGCCGGDLATHYVLLTGDPGAATVLFEEDITPVGGTQTYRRRYAIFTASSASQEIRFEHVPTGDRTLLLDNIRILPGEVTTPPPLQISRGADGTLTLSWPVIPASLGCVLQSAPTPAGPWVNDPALVTAQAIGAIGATVTPAQTARYYRLSL